MHNSERLHTEHGVAGTARNDATYSKNLFIALELSVSAITSEISALSAKPLNYALYPDWLEPQPQDMGA